MTASLARNSDESDSSDRGGSATSRRLLDIGASLIGPPESYPESYVEPYSKSHPESKPDRPSYRAHSHPSTDWSLYALGRRARDARCPTGSGGRLRDSLGVASVDWGI